MPRARIITRSADISQEILELLRARGFEIEMVDPEAEVSEPVDLEIKLEEYTPEEALDRAELMPESTDLCAFVAPGALAGEPVLGIPLLSDMSDSSELTLQRLRFMQQARNSGPLAEVSASLRAKSENGDTVGPELNPGREFDPHELDVVAENAPVAEAAPLALSEASLPAPGPATEIAPLAAAAPEPTAAVSWLASIRVTLSQLFREAESLWALADQRAAYSSLPSQRYRTRTISDDAFWKAATVFAALAVSALLVGASVRRSPLPAVLTQREQGSQRIPFAAARPSSSPSVQIEAVLTQPEQRSQQIPFAATHPSSSSAVQIEDETQGERSRSSKAEEIVAEVLSESAPPAFNTSGARTAPRAVRRRHSTNERSLVADDVVIYYDKKPVPPRRVAKSDGIKRYSDLN